MLSQFIQGRDHRLDLAIVRHIVRCFSSFFRPENQGFERYGSIRCCGLLVATELRGSGSMEEAETHFSVINRSAAALDRELLLVTVTNTRGESALLSFADVN